MAMIDPPKDMNRYKRRQGDKSMEKPIDPAAVRLSQKLFGSGILNNATAQQNLLELQKAGSYTSDNREQLYQALRNVQRFSGSSQGIMTLKFYILCVLFFFFVFLCFFF